jgi:Ca2+-binding RTX toxin-like protein
MATITGNNGNNNLQGTGQNDLIYGLDGDDTLNGGNGNDSLYGGRGNDTLTGGNGADTMEGGEGNDVYNIDSSDTLVELANEGVDEVRASFSYSLQANFENLRLGGNSAINGTGNSANNEIWGNSAANILDGAGGADILRGGGGNDIYITDGGDTLIENNNSGTDEVRSSATHNLASNFENLTLTGADNIDGTGNSAANVLRGNSGNNVLNGGNGTDTLIGGFGDDTYVYDGVDSIVESVGEGVDTILSSVTHALAAAFENLTLTGTAAINGTGNASNNVIIGNSGNNVLTSGSGDDTVDGGAGIDTFVMTRPVGSFYLTSVNLTTGVATGDGTDTLSNIENVIGTEFTDYITGDANNNVISGMGSHDELFASNGIDVLDGGLGADAARFDNTGAVNASLTTGVYTIDANNHGTMISLQHIVGSAFNDVLTGDGAVNHMSGGAGDDLMTGGAGNDQIWGGGGSDRLVADFGNDTLSGNYNYITGFGENSTDYFEILTTAGNVTVNDFERGEDKLDLTAFGFDQNGVSAYWTGDAVQSGPHTVLTLTGLGNEVVTINLQGVTDGHLLSASDFIGGSASLIPPPPSYPINGGNGVVDDFLIDPLDIINNHAGNLTIDHFENGLDHLDVSSMNLMSGGYWDGYLSNVPGGDDAVLEFYGAQGEEFSVTLTGMPYWLIDQSDYIL